MAEDKPFPTGKCGTAHRHGPHNQSVCTICSGLQERYDSPKFAICNTEFLTSYGYIFSIEEICKCQKVGRADRPILTTVMPMPTPSKSVMLAGTNSCALAQHFNKQHSVATVPYLYISLSPRTKNSTRCSPHENRPVFNYYITATSVQDRPKKVAAVVFCCR